VPQALFCLKLKVFLWKEEAPCRTETVEKSRSVSSDRQKNAEYNTMARSSYREIDLVAFDILD